MYKLYLNIIDSIDVKELRTGRFYTSSFLKGMTCQRCYALSIKADSEASHQDTQLYSLKPREQRKPRGSFICTPVPGFESLGCEKKAVVVEA